MPIAPGTTRHPTFFLKIHTSHPDARYAGRTLELRTAFARSDDFYDWLENGGIWYIVDAEQYAGGNVEIERVIDIEEITSGKLYIAMPLPSDEFDE